MKKCCTKCGIECPRTKEYFYSDKRAKDGLSSWCKKCENIKCKKYREKNPEYNEKYYKKYRETLRGYIIHLMCTIKKRCTDSKAPNYKYYGGRGIKCIFTSDELYDWLILNNIDPRGLQIHRINNGGNYVLDNIIFLSSSEHSKLHWLERKKKW